MASNTSNLKLDFNKISSVHFFKSEQQSPVEIPTIKDKDLQDEQLSPLKKKALVFYQRLGGANDFSNSPKDLQHISKPQLLSKIDIVNTYKVKHLQSGILKEQKYEAINGSNSQFKLNFGYQSKESQKCSVDNDLQTQSLLLDFRKSSQTQQPQPFSQQLINQSSISNSIKINNDQDHQNKFTFQHNGRSKQKHSSLKSFPKNTVKIQSNNIGDEMNKDYQNQNNLLIDSTKLLNKSQDIDQQINVGLSIFKNEFIQKVASLTSLQSPVTSSRVSASAIFFSSPQKQSQQQVQQELVSFQEYAQNQLKRASQESLDKSTNSISKNRTKQNNSTLMQSLNTNILSINQQLQMQKSNSERKGQHPLIQKHIQQQNNKNINKINLNNNYISPLQSPTAPATQLSKLGQKNIQSNINIIDMNIQTSASQTDFETKNTPSSHCISPLERLDKGSQSPISPLESPGIPVRLNNMSFEKRFKLLQMNAKFYPYTKHKSNISLSPCRIPNLQTPKVNGDLTPNINEKQTKKNSILYSQVNSIKRKRNSQNKMENEDSEQTQIIQHLYPEVQMIQKPQIQFDNLNQMIKNSSLTTINNLIKKEINRISEIIPVSYENMIKDSMEDYQNDNITSPKSNHSKEISAQNQLNEKAKQQNDQKKKESIKLNLMQQVNIFTDQINNGVSPSNKITSAQLSNIDFKPKDNLIHLQQEKVDSPSRKIQQSPSIQQRYSIRDSFQQRVISQVQQQVNNRLSITYANASTTSNTPSQNIQEIKSENSFSDLILKNSIQRSMIHSNTNITPKNQDPEKNKKILKCLFLKSPQDSPFKSIQKQRKYVNLEQN